MWCYGLLWGSLLPILPGELPVPSLWEEPKGCVALKVSVSPQGAESQGNVLLSLNKKHTTSWGIRWSEQGSLKTHSTELSVAAVTPSSRGSYHLGTPSNKGLPGCLGRHLRLPGVTKLPILSRGWSNRNMKEVIPQIKPSRPRNPVADFPSAMIPRN